MTSRNNLFAITAICAGIAGAPTAQAGNQLFEGSWSVKSFGNECRDATDPTPGPHCGNGAIESEFYSAIRLPQGIQCNPNQPRCPYESTPTDGEGNWSPLGGNRSYALFCAPWYNWRGCGTVVRPSRTRSFCPTGCCSGPPFYRPPGFFTPAGQPHVTSCTAISTGATPGGKGRVQAGQPITGKWSAVTTGTQRGGFSFTDALRDGGGGIRTTGQIGQINAIGPNIYRYTYATLRNRAGSFGPGQGPGSFNLVKKQGTQPVASINVKQGAAKFGGTMAMLGGLTSKACYYRNGGCSLGTNNGRYDVVGTSAFTYLGVVTAGYVVTFKAYYHNPALMLTSTVRVEGSRFSWTTGSVTVTAVGRGPHNTVHYARGYDNRNTTTPSGKGTIQLVTPVLTRWLQTAATYETAGIGILKIKFMPEPHAWAMLIAGASLLGVAYRLHSRRSSSRRGSSREATPIA